MFGTMKRLCGNSEFGIYDVRRSNLRGPDSVLSTFPQFLNFLYDFESYFALLDSNLYFLAFRLMRST